MSNSWDRVQEERKKLVQQIIDNMKKGYVLPKPGWDEGVFAIGRINNPVSHARYRGINLVRLYIDQMANGYKDGRYMTYKQAQSQGWQVKKGAVGIRLEKYLFDKVVEEKNEETGEIEKNRKLNSVFGSESYAREELRAELGAFFIQTDLGLNFDAQHFNSHTQYLESWISALEDDPNELFRAISDAQKASDYLEERYERVKEIGEEYIAEKEITFPVKGWTRNSDGSGSLIAADGTEIASYDLSTSELNVKLPFTEDKLYENYTDSECSFEIVRDRAVQWINYKVLDNLEREAKVIAEGYREDENNYYRIIRNENLENPITVEKVTYGQCGFGKQCKNTEEVKEFIETFTPTPSTERRASVHGEQEASLTERELATVRMAVKRERKREGAGEQHIKAWLDKREQEYKELGISFHRERGVVMMQVYNRMKNEPVEHKDMKKAACR